MAGLTSSMISASYPLNEHIDNYERYHLWEFDLLHQLTYL